MNIEGCWGIVLFGLGILAWVADIPAKVSKFLRRLFEKE